MLFWTIRQVPAPAGPFDGHDAAGIELLAPAGSAVSDVLYHCLQHDRSGDAADILYSKRAAGEGSSIPYGIFPVDECEDSEYIRTNLIIGSSLYSTLGLTR